MTITIREAEIPPGLGEQIGITYINPDWVPVFDWIPDQAEGIESVLGPWLADRLDLPADPESAVGTDDRLELVDPAYPPIITAEYVATVRYDSDENEWIVDIEDAVDPVS